MRWRDISKEPPTKEVNAKFKMSDGTTCRGFVLMHPNEDITFFVPKRYANHEVLMWRPMKTLLDIKLTWALMGVCLVIALIVIIALLVNPPPHWLME